MWNRSKRRKRARRLTKRASRRWWRDQTLSGEIHHLSDVRFVLQDSPTWPWDTTYRRKTGIARTATDWVKRWCYHGRKGAKAKRQVEHMIRQTVRHGEFESAMRFTRHVQQLVSERSNRGARLHTA